MSTSNLQRQVSALLYAHLGQYIIRENRRPEWLEGLELDFYIEELRVGIEVQGQQHYEYTPHFHKSYGKYLEQKDRDERKAALCEYHRVDLRYITHQRDILPLIETLIAVHFPTVHHAKALEQQAKWKQAELKRKLIEDTKDVRKSIGRDLRAVNKEKNRDHPRPDRIEKYERKVIEKWGKLSIDRQRCIFETLEGWQHQLTTILCRN